MFVALLALIIAIDGSISDTAMQYIGVDKGITPSVIGICGSIYFTISVVASVTFQKLVYKLGYKPLFLVLSLFTISSGLLLFTNNILLYCIGLIIFNVGAWTSWTLFESYVIDINNDATQYGKLQLWISIGNLIGLLIYATLSIFDITHKSYIIVSLCIANYIILFVAMMHRKNVKPEQQTSRNKNIGYFNLIHDKLMKNYFAYYSVTAVQYMLFSGLQAILLRDFLSISENYVIYYFLILKIINTVFLKTIIEYKRYTMRKNILYSSCILLITTSTIGLLIGGLMLIVTLVVSKLFYNFTSIAIEELVHTQYADGRSSLVIGLQTTAEFAGYVIGIGLAGLLLEFDYMSIFRISLILFVITTLLCINLHTQINNAKNITCDNKAKE